jgi:short-subunit dehydrogenase
MNLEGKTIIVTGAGSGMGRHLTLGLLKRGANVAGLDIQETTLKETVDLAGELGTNASIHVADQSKKEAVDTVVQEIIERWKTVDGVINNAGIIQPFVPIKDLDFETIERVVNVNFYGVLYLTKALLPYLISRPEAVVVNISSMGGFLPVPGQSIYGATKAAVKLMTEALSAELLDTNVHVCVVFPGAIDTNINKNSGVEMPMSEAEMEKQKEKFKPLPASEAAEQIISAMEKKKPRVFVGKDSKAMDLLYRVAPNFAIKLIAKQMKSLLKN